MAGYLGKEERGNASQRPTAYKRIYTKKQKEKTMTDKELMLSYIEKVKEWFLVKKNPLSFTEGSLSCRYHGDNGTMCAFAVIVPEELRHLLVEGKNSVAILDATKEIRNAVCGDGIPASFFSRLQSCHDQSVNYVVVLNHQDSAKEQMSKLLRNLESDVNLGKFD